MPVIMPQSAPVIVASPRAPTLPGTEPQAVEKIEVEVRVGAAVIWRGPLRVTTLSGANFQQTLFEPPEMTCDGVRGFVTPVQTGLSVQLSTDRSTDTTQGRYRLAVRWTRPGGDRCPAYATTRSVEVNTVIVLPPGASTVVSGDGDLVVRLTRR